MEQSEKTRPRLEVATPVFEGPLELLVALAERDDIDILKVRLSELTDGYLAAIATATIADPTEVADFLWMASRLLVLKSIRLLPGEPPDQQEAELLGWEEDVRRHLDEYRLYKEMAHGLMVRVAEEPYAFAPPPRPVDADGQEEPIEVGTLLSAFQQVLARLPPRPLVFQGRAWTLDEKLVALEGRLRSGSVELTEIILACEDRLEAVVTFVALLELLRRGRVKVRQKQSFGQIWVEEAA
jgi:segregation and condensation protein A